MKEFELGSVVQIAYMVDDVHEAAADFSARTGAGPFFVRRNVVTAADGPDGRTGAFDHSSAYGQWGRMQIELVQTHSAEPPEFAETTRARGCVHHVAIMVASFAEHRQQLIESGWPALLSASTPHGNNSRSTTPGRSSDISWRSTSRDRALSSCIDALPTPRRTGTESTPFAACDASRPPRGGQPLVRGPASEPEGCRSSREPSVASGRSSSHRRLAPPNPCSTRRW